ncbi:hypothetical protein [Kordiimonas sp.]|uniref:hypothetical protein n=1 Tax=Kordiimonas sp. TaxID=1970157 RepID=UPI003A9509C7
MKYEAFKPLDKTAAGEMLLSGDEEKIVYGLLGAVEGDTDWRWVQDQCLRFVNDPRENVARVAIQCLGHLARLERKLDLEKVLPVLDACTVHKNPLIRGVAEDAKGDIKVFVK